MKRITSRENPFFRELLHVATSARERRRREASVLDGIHLCQAYLGAVGQPRATVVAESALGHPEVAELVARLRDEPVIVADALFAALSQVDSGVGVAMRIDTPRPGLPARIDDDCVYLDRLQDPGNVGGILRTCAAAGIPRVLASPGTAFCWSPKVLRAGMGAHFHLQIHESVPWAELAPRLAVEARATVARGGEELYRADLRAPAIWLLGNEGEGLDAGLLSHAGQRIRIPQATGVESLNVAVAAAVCLYEQLRQRRFVGQGGAQTPRRRR